MKCSYIYFVNRNHSKFKFELNSNEFVIKKGFEYWQGFSFLYSDCGLKPLSCFTRSLLPGPACRPTPGLSPLLLPMCATVAKLVERRPQHRSDPVPRRPTLPHAVDP
jgi:hypothetical protein